MKRFITYVLIAFSLLLGAVACKTDGFNQQEIELIYSGDENSKLPLFTIEQINDSLLLRQSARNIKSRYIGSDALELLRKRMLATVRDSLDPGVGIAAPQVGFSVRMVYVQRFDKVGEPFEIYYNPVIELYGDSINSGSEGCLSVPYYRGRVDRSQNITISYLDSLGQKRQEKINDFTSVIFQHEIDHINGILYFDHVDGGFDALMKIDEL